MPLPGVPPAPRKPLFRWRDAVGLAILLLVVFPLVLHSCRLVSRSSDEGRQSDPASRESGIDEVSAIPWTVDGDILYPLAAVRPADEWANGAQRAWSVGLSAPTSGFGSTGKRYAANGNVMWEASTGVRDYVVRGSAASGGGEWIWLDGLGEPGVFLNTATGQVKRAERRATGKCWSTRAVDGWLVACEGDSQIASFAADGTAGGAFDAARWPLSTRGEGECSDAGVPVWQGAPTLDEAIAYYRDGDESRTLGTLTAADCGHVEYRTPGGRATTIDISGDDPDLWQFVLGEFGHPSTGVGQWFHFAISDGGRILAVGNTALVDVGSGEHVGLPRATDSSDQLPLKAPGLVLGVDGSGVVAAAPGR